MSTKNQKSGFNGFGAVKEVVESAIGEVIEGKILTNRGHISVNAEEGFSMALRPKDHELSILNNRENRRKRIKNGEQSYIGTPYAQTVPVVVYGEAPLGITEEQRNFGLDMSDLDDVKTWDDEDAVAEEEVVAEMDDDYDDEDSDDDNATKTPVKKSSNSSSKKKSSNNRKKSNKK